MPSAGGVACGKPGRCDCCGAPRLGGHSGTAFALLRRGAGVTLACLPSYGPIWLGCRLPDADHFVLLARRCCQGAMAHSRARGLSAPAAIESLLWGMAVAESRATHTTRQIAGFAVEVLCLAAGGGAGTTWAQQRRIKLGLGAKEAADPSEYSVHEPPSCSG